MDAEKQPVILPWNDSGDTAGGHNTKTHDSKDLTFDDVLDSTCDRLFDKHTKYSLKRIQEMDEKLTKLEKELNLFISAISN